jgi:hypothetical protein
MTGFSHQWMVALTKIKLKRKIPDVGETESATAYKTMSKGV